MHYYHEILHHKSFPQILCQFQPMSYMLWMLKRVFFGKLPENFSKVKEGSWYMLSPMMVLAGFTIVLGIYPDIFLSKIMPYMQGVLGG